MSVVDDAPAAASRRAKPGFWLVAAVYVLAMLGGTLPVPLYVFWAPRMGFGPFTTTLIFAIYALGVVASLLLFASLSDRSGGARSCWRRWSCSRPAPCASWWPGTSACSCWLGSCAVSLPG
ncbi:hypothetical protein ACFQ0O_11565 [Saccharopolyspora spinosporotrichia]